jgi:hypothetical protein
MLELFEQMKRAPPSDGSTSSDASTTLEVFGGAATNDALSAEAAVARPTPPICLDGVQCPVCENDPQHRVHGCTHTATPDKVCAAGCRYECAPPTDAEKRRNLAAITALCCSLNQSADPVANVNDTGFAGLTRPLHKQHLIVPPNEETRHVVFSVQAASAAEELTLYDYCRQQLRGVTDATTDATKLNPPVFLEATAGTMRGVLCSHAEACVAAAFAQMEHVSRATDASSSSSSGAGAAQDAHWKGRDVHAIPQVLRLLGVSKLPSNFAPTLETSLGDASKSRLALFEDFMKRCPRPTSERSVSTEDGVWTTVPHAVDQSPEPIHSPTNRASSNTLTELAAGQDTAGTILTGVMGQVLAEQDVAQDATRHATSGFGNTQLNLPRWAVKFILAQYARQEPYSLIVSKANVFHNVAMTLPASETRIRREIRADNWLTWETERHAFPSQEDPSAPYAYITPAQPAGLPDVRSAHGAPGGVAVYVHTQQRPCQRDEDLAWFSADWSGMIDQCQQMQVCAHRETSDLEAIVNASTAEGSSSSSSSAAAAASALPEACAFLELVSAPKESAAIVTSEQCEHEAELAFGLRQCCVKQQATPAGGSGGGGASQKDMCFRCDACDVLLATKEHMRAASDLAYFVGQVYFPLVRAHRTRDETRRKELRAQEKEHAKEIARLQTRIDANQAGGSKSKAKGDGVGVPDDRVSLARARLALNATREELFAHGEACYSTADHRHVYVHAPTVVAYLARHAYQIGWLTFMDANGGVRVELRHCAGKSLYETLHDVCDQVYRELNQGRRRYESGGEPREWLTQFTYTEPERAAIDKRGLSLWFTPMRQLTTEWSLAYAPVYSHYAPFRMVPPQSEPQLNE